MKRETAVHRLTATRRAAALVMSVTLAACGGGSEGEMANEDTAVLVGPENIVVVDSVDLASGPSLSGSLQPERAASIRAEVGGTVLQTLAEVGQRVRVGTSLARIEDTAIRDAFFSAQSAVTTAQQAASVARRNAERATRLAEAGAIAERDLEAARVAATTAEAQHADANARLAQAQKQLESTRVLAPITGIVSERAVSAGDVVSPGLPLFTVVDPTGMRLEAAVSASEIGKLRIGAPVDFTVNGYGERIFSGEITRINPTVDPATGQVGVMVSIPNAGGHLLGGVFAQGRIGTDAKRALAAPLNAVQISSSGASVLRIRNGTIERVNVQTGIRDEQAERIEVVSGLALGDTLLAGAAQGYTPGTPVRIQSLADSPAVER
ncbi:MAG: efflux RND transporter periplasmic adaptor subunit [Longimicrobiales bacterium]